jgi:hypothetical protein
LDLARGPLEQKRRARAGNGSGRRIADLRIGVIELRRVQEVERLSAELQTPAGAFVKSKVLDKR